MDPEIPLLLRGDALRLTQILVNFLSNALKFTPEGDITLRAEFMGLEAAGLVVRLSVSDQGHGLSPE
jgi:signal transduction histidine kinase